MTDETVMMTETELCDHLVNTAHKGVLRGRVSDSALRDLAQMLFRSHERNGFFPLQDRFQKEFLTASSYLIFSMPAEQMAQVANRHGADLKDFMNVVQVFGEFGSAGENAMHARYNDHVENVVSDIGNGAPYSLIIVFALKRTLSDCPDSPELDGAVRCADKLFFGMFT